MHLLIGQNKEIFSRLIHTARRHCSQLQETGDFKGSIRTGPI